MESDNNKSKIIMHIVLGIIIVIIIILLLPSKSDKNQNQNSILNVTAPESLLVGENGTINVNTDAENIRVIYKYGYLSSPSITYPGGNNVVIPFTANKSGTEEVEIKTTNMSKNIFINCYFFYYWNSSFSILGILSWIKKILIK